MVGMIVFFLHSFKGRGPIISEVVLKSGNYQKVLTCYL